MDVVNLRIASFLKMVSMFMVIGSLIYMYGYVEDKVNFLNETHNWISQISKNHIFYGALITFAISNLLLSISLSVYQSSKGYNPKSYIFKNRERKEQLILMFTYLIAGVNVMLTTFMVYITLMRMNRDSVPMDYVYLPAFGIFLLAGILVVTITILLKK